MTTKGRLMGRGEDDYDNLTPTHLDYEAAAASSDSNPAMLFTLGEERGRGNCNRIHQACVRCFNTGLSTRLYLLVLVMTNREARILRGGGGVNPQKKSRSTKGGGEVSPTTLCLGGRSVLGFRKDGGGDAQRNRGWNGDVKIN